MERSKIQNIISVALFVTFGCAAISCSRPEIKPPPPVETAPVVEPEKPQEDVIHTISISGETLGLIARWYSGDSNNWAKIKDANPGLVPERLKIGQQIKIPLAILVRRDAMTADFVSAKKAISSVTKLNNAQEADPLIGDQKANLIPEKDLIPGSGKVGGSPKGQSAVTKQGAVFPTMKAEELGDGMKASPGAGVGEPVENNAVNSGAETIARDPDYREDVERQKLLRELLGGK